jgi:hypothetical protein
MFCCAIAAFILGQLYLAVTATRRGLFGREAKKPRRGGAAQWRLDATESEPASQSKNRPTPWGWFDFSVRRVLVISSLTLMILGGAYALDAMSKNADQSSFLRGLVSGVMCTSTKARPAN